MGTFFLLLFIFFIVIPLCRALWRGWQFHRRWREATRGMRDAFARASGTAADGSDKRRQPHSAPAKKKKIDPSVGEYVAFEEIHVSSTESTQTRTDAAGRTHTTVHTESQIEDAVWEDIR